MVPNKPYKQTVSEIWRVGYSQLQKLTWRGGISLIVWSALKQPRQKSILLMSIFWQKAINMLRLQLWRYFFHTVHFSPCHFWDGLFIEFFVLVTNNTILSWCFPSLKPFTTLQLMNAKISKQSFWHSYENRLIKTIQTIPTTIK